MTWVTNHYYDKKRSKTQNKASTLLSIIQRYPSVRYRQLQRLTGFSGGSLSYHLHQLKTQNRIKLYKPNSRIARFFPPDLDNDYDCSLMGQLCQHTSKKIICSILNSSTGCTHKEIVKKTNISPSTISWHLKRMQTEGILFAVNEDNSNHHHKRLYKLYQSNRAWQIIHNYNKSLQ